MNAEEAQKHRKAWFGIPCGHPCLEQEILNETWTGMYVCQACGSEFSKVAMWEPVHHFLERERASCVLSADKRSEGTTTGAGNH